MSTLSVRLGVAGLAMASLAVVACGSSKAPAAHCDLADGRRIPAGAAFGDGCNCCVCADSGEVYCQAASCTGDAGAPVGGCQSDDDCVAQGKASCVFDPGCASPRGTCIGTLGVCPLFMVSNLAPFQYCGCDGVTYSIVESPAPREYPYQPYEHFGACP